jgi:hypothetical protein
MKRIRIPLLVDIVLSKDAAEIESLAQDPKLDRAYANRSILVNGLILRRLHKVLQFNGKSFPTVSPRDAEGRAIAQEALWTRLNATSSHYASGPDELESLAVFVRGVTPGETCGPLVQNTVGRLFNPNFKATKASWDAALVLNKAPRTMNPILLLWWAVTGRVDRARLLLAEMVEGDLAAMHAIGVALHNIVDGVNRMRQLYSDPVQRSALSGESAKSQCLFAPATVIRQPGASESSANGELETGTLVILQLQSANAKLPSEDVVFLKQSWSRCPAEQWVPALLEGIWNRACSDQRQGPSSGNAAACPFAPPQATP